MNQRNILPILSSNRCMKLTTITAALFGFLSVSYSARAVDTEPDTALDAVLARMPKPWLEEASRFNLEEYEGTLRYWRKTHPAIFNYEQRGTTREGLPIYLLKITDPAVPDEDKQHALITSLHAGLERSGTASIIRFVEWLLGDDVLAVETRKKQVVLLMPILNPGLFFDWGDTRAVANSNSQGVDLYSGRIPALRKAGERWGPSSNIWDTDELRLKYPEKAPELVAYLSVVDEFQPEVAVDMHGVGMLKSGEIMFQSAGSHSNYAIRPWDERFTELMRQGAETEGYGSSRGDAEAQRILGGSEVLEPQARKLAYARAEFYSPCYCYFKYHTLLSVTEIAWPDGGAALLRGVMRIGNRRWYDELYEGYPVGHLSGDFALLVTAWGRNAGERRTSRVELWNRQKDFIMSGLNPEIDGRLVVFCAVTSKGRNLLKAPDTGGQERLSVTPDAFLEGIRANQDFNANALETIMKGGPETMIRGSRPGRKGGDSRPAIATPVEHGIGFRLRINYRQPRILDLRLNGHPLAESDIDGYRVWFADGFTQIQINVPPEKVKKADLFVVSLLYSSGEERAYGWRPPPEVLKRMEETR
jgi:hypothetical protein